MTIQDRYAYLADRYPVVTRYNRLLRKISALIEATGLQGNLKINEDLLGRAVVDYFEDIDRLKDFEGIDRVAVSKIYAYQTYWLSLVVKVVVSKLSFGLLVSYMGNARFCLLTQAALCSF